ncbi:hypothetical protein GGI11_004018 [Coemansia sp. RSA 2049]|nr:hypothetical protein GGI11_004018 [Coemansia sp. RSA 2049]
MATTFHASEPTLFVKQEFKAGSNPTRLIFIGDIHGCIDQFNSLLGEVQFKQGEDQVVLVGDLVAKGPSSIEVVQKARSINAWCVRGNHDDRVIRWREFLDGPAKGLTKDDISALEDSDNLPYSDFKVSEIHFDIAQQLAVDDFAFLQSFPVIMALPTPYTEWIIVHGGLDASRAVLEQNSDNCMTMRNIGPNGPSSSKDEGVAWFDIWASKMKVVSALPSSPLSSASSEIDYSKVNFNKIIYGHDAGRGLQIHEHTKGLDSRCVYGGNLTAFILPGEQLASVGCSNYVNSSNDD